MGQVGPVDYHPAGLASSRSRRWAYLAVGHGFLVLGIIGAFLPIMPTTVFLIAAASCYARGSARLHARLLAHPTYGPILRDWRDHRAMSRRAKLVAVTMIAVSFSLSFFLIPLAWVRVVHVGIGLALIAFILRIRTR